MAKGAYIGVQTNHTYTNILGEIGDMATGTVYKTTAEAAYVKNSSQYKFGSSSQAFQQSNSATELTYTLRDSSGQMSFVLDNTHQYYFSVWIQQKTSLDLSFDWYWPVAEPSVMSGVKNTALNVWEHHSAVVDRSGFTSGSYPMRIDCNNYPGNNALMYVDGLMVVDLTATYGAGNEPTKEFCDQYFAFTTGTNTVTIPTAQEVKKLYIGVGGVARKVKKAYIGVGGVARLFYSSGPDVAAMGITYTGTMIDSGIVTMSGVQYRLLTLTSSGTLTVDEEVNAEVWMCGGGTSGVYDAYAYSIGSGGGAGAFTATGAVTLSGGMAAIVGSGGATPTSSSGSEVHYVKGGATSFNGLETSVAFSAPDYYNGGISGGTGGGAGGGSGIGFGDGITKYPFEDSTYFSGKPHCAGGGGGAGFEIYGDDTYIWKAGAGGSNGGNGSAGASGSPAADTGAGGLFGGGNGASSATFYGGGGGGNSNSNFTAKRNAGSGYQGVIYIRIPVEQ